LDTVGDDLAGDQAVAHALVAHHDAIGGRRCAEDLGHAAAGADALAALAGQAVEMSVAGGDVAEEGGDTDHGPGEIPVVEAAGPQDGAVGGAIGNLATGGLQAGTLWLRRHAGQSPESVMPSRAGVGILAVWGGSGEEAHLTWKIVASGVVRDTMNGWHA